MLKHIKKFGSDIKNKSNILFYAPQKELSLYLEMIAEDILESFDAVIWYDEKQESDTVMEDDLF